MRGEVGVREGVKDGGDGGLLWSSRPPVSFHSILYVSDCHPSYTGIQTSFAYHTLKNEGAEREERDTTHFEWWYCCGHVHLRTSTPCFTQDACLYMFHTS